jgi:Flp pilus assembly protein TadD
LSNCRSYANAWYNKCQALAAQGKYIEAVQALNRAIELKPADAMALYKEGMALKLMGRTTEAGAAFAKAK